jgi:hypothetical protein
MRPYRRRLGFGILMAVALLAIGTAYYSYQEGWSAVDSFYFSTMTLTTIGYGDLVPATDAGKIFTSFYALFGIGTMLYIMGSLINGLIFRQERAFSKLFSSFNPFGRRMDELGALKNQVQRASMTKIKKQEREIKELKQRVDKAPVIIQKQENEIKGVRKEVKSLRKRLRKRS